MALSFGEIVEPTTRAIFEEFSDEEDNSNDPELKPIWIRNDVKPPSVIEVVLIIHGKLSLAFAETCLINENSSVAAEIKIIDDECNFDNEIKNHHKKIFRPSRIYIEKNNVICLVSPSFSSEMGYQFSETISQFLKTSKKIIILTNDSVYNFKTDNFSQLPPAFINELKTSHGSQEYAAQKLEIPNFISGIPAGVLSWCQINKKNASAFVCYTDQQKLDSITAMPYISVMKRVCGGLLKVENPDFSKKTFYGKPGIIGESSNIYM